MDEPEITVMLRAWSSGDAAAADNLFPVIYGELRRLAACHQRPGGGETLHPTALVHEAYLQLLSSAKEDWRDRSQFFAFTSIVMRRLILQYSRSKRAAKRGGEIDWITLDDSAQALLSGGLDIEELDASLELLAAVNPVQAKVVELRFFGGLSVAETAECLEMSARTVNRQWGLAKTWLAAQLRR